LNDFEALKKALAELELREGVWARNRLVHGVLHNMLKDDPVARKEAQGLSGLLVEEQRARGSHAPQAGELTAAEAMFWAWLWEKEEMNE